MEPLSKLHQRPLINFYTNKTILLCTGQSSFKESQMVWIAKKRKVMVLTKNTWYVNMLCLPKFFRLTFVPLQFSLNRIWSLFEAFYSKLLTRVGISRKTCFEDFSRHIVIWDMPERKTKTLFVRSSLNSLLNPFELRLFL